MNLPHTTIHKQTRSGSLKQKYDSFDNLQHEPLGTNWGLFPPKFCLCLFPICSTTWRLLCCWAVRRKGMWQGFQRAGQKHSVIWREPCNTAESERGCVCVFVWGGGDTVGSSPRKTHPVISSTPEQLFLQLRSWHTQLSVDALACACKETRVHMRTQYGSVGDRGLTMSYSRADWLNLIKYTNVTRVHENTHSCRLILVSCQCLRITDHLLSKNEQYSDDKSLNRAVISCSRHNLHWIMGGCTQSEMMITVLWDCGGFSK